MTQLLDRPPATSTGLRAIVDRVTFTEALQLCAAVAPPRIQNPILMCVSIRTEGTGLILHATNLESHIEVRVDQVQVESSGEVLVNASRLLDIFRECSLDTASIRLDGTQLIVIADDQFKVATISGQLPPIPETESKSSINISAQKLAGMIRQAQISIGITTQFQLAGIYFEISKDAVRLVSADTVQMSVVGGKAKTTATGIVPKTAIGAMMRLLDGDEMISVMMGERSITLKDDAVEFSSVLMEGTFPQYEGAIQKNPAIKIKLGREDLLATARRAKLIVKDGRGYAKIKCAISSKGLHLSGRSSTGGDSYSGYVPCKCDGPEMEIGFDIGRMADAIAIAASDEVLLEFTSPTKSIGLHEVGGGRDFSFYLFPCNIEA